MHWNEVGHEKTLMQLIGLGIGTNPRTARFMLKSA